MASIFISYRREPQAAWARLLHDRLAPRFGGDNVFLDVDILAGDDFVAVLEERVSRCNVLIALIGRDWKPERLALPEDFVRLEIETALRLGIRVIPVLVDGVGMPVAGELPDSLKPLTRRQAHHVNHVSFKGDVEALMGMIEKVLIRGKTGEPGPVKASSREPWVNPADGQKYVWIPAGRFQMGASPGDEECSDDEEPAHPVEITQGFWLGETAVTQSAWRKVMGTSPSYFKGDQLPVENVDWNQASQYCSKIGGRLPTEAEWEYAARGGTTGARYGELDAVAWYGDNSGKQRLDSAKIWREEQSKYGERIVANGNGTKPVRGKQPNPFGLYDMLGNVWEWTADRYGPYEALAVRDPKGPSTGDNRPVRGGSWLGVPRAVRSSYRAGGGVEGRNYDVGFRCAGEFR